MPEDIVHVHMRVTTFWRKSMFKFMKYTALMLTHIIAFYVGYFLQIAEGLK